MSTAIFTGIAHVVAEVRAEFPLRRHSNLWNQEFTSMSCLALKRVFAAALLVVGFGTAIVFSSPHAQPSGYRFELVDREVKLGFGTTVLVRLVDDRTGNVVPDATLFISDLNMSPDGMGQMNAPLELIPDTPRGYFRFETGLTMGGNWALILVAQVPGAPDAVRSRLVLQAVA